MNTMELGFFSYYVKQTYQDNRLLVVNTITRIPINSQLLLEFKTRLLYGIYYSKQDFTIIIIAAIQYCMSTYIASSGSSPSPCPLPLAPWNRMMVFQRPEGPVIYQGPEGL